MPLLFRSSHRRGSVRKCVFRNFAKFTGKHLCQSLFFNKVAVLRPATLLKKRLWHRCFPVKFAIFLRTTFLQNTSGRLFLFFKYHSIFYEQKQDMTLREKRPYSELFWSTFSRIRTECWEMLRISQYSVRMQEMRTRITSYTNNLYTVWMGIWDQ